MSWKAFDEFKTFASKIKDQCKRKKDWNKPSSKKQKSSERGSVESEETGIDRFSSDEEQDEPFSHRPVHTGKHKLDSPSKRKSIRPYNPRKRIRTDNDLSDQIDDSEETPEAKEVNTKPSDIRKSGERRSKYNCPDADEASQLMETLDVMIKDFNSSDEDKKEDEEPDIETPTPSPTESPCSTPTPIVTQSEKAELSATGSEWLKKVKLIASQSKEEASTCDVTKTDLDSAKKTKQKFKRSGLAEQLQKVINREKSDKTFWIHKQTTGIQDAASSLDVQILSVQVQHSLYITRCYELSSKNDNDEPLVFDVIFNAETSRQLVPRIGSAVRIYPPWQKLHPLSSPYPVLLCTYFCEKIPTPSGSSAIDLASLPDSCVIHNQRDKESSRLTQSPQKAFKPTKLLFESIKEASRCCSYDQRMSLPSIAKAIELQGGCSGETVSFPAVIQRMYRRRVKIARNKTVDSPGHLALSKSLITRARNGEDKEEVRWTFLVQDSSLNLCEIQVPSEFAEQDDWVSCVKSGEGKQYNFLDLVISQRTNRTRAPGLFSVVDSLWCIESTNHSQADKSSQINSSQDSDGQLSPPLSTPPSYCYVLTVQENSHLSPCDVDIVTSLYKPPTRACLKELLLCHETPKRLSVWCRVICSRATSSTRNIDCQRNWTGQLFVTDASLHSNANSLTLEAHSTINKSTQEAQNIVSFSQYTKIEVRSSFVMSETIHTAVLEAGNVLYFQDVMCTRTDSQVLYADSYTTIKKGATDPCQADLDTGDIKVMPLSIYSELVALRTREFISPLLPALNSGLLCKVEGMIEGVDEESACCWLECTVCACQDLLERSGFAYYCPVCQGDVSDPTTKTNLDVIIKCDSWRDSHITVKLLQTTIEQLLPVSYQDSDQGYDIECVLGKRLGPLYCYIEEQGEQSAKLAEISVSL